MTLSAALDPTVHAVERPIVLPLVASLLEQLERRDIRYCLWKSTTRLAEVLGGRTDADVLVGRESVEAWELLVEELGFKPFISHESRSYPGIEDRIGFDEDSGRLVHLHVHHQLLLGQRYVKNHHLPIEEALLSSALLSAGVRIPPPELELAILTVRCLLKYRDADALKDLLRLGRRGGLPPDALSELEDLAARTDDGVLSSSLERWAPMIPARLVRELVATVRRDRRDAAALLRLRGWARRALMPYERTGARRADLAYLGARVSRQWPLSLITKSPSRRQARRKSPVGGGTTIAIVGADGSGKTTVVDASSSWLSSRVRLRTYYLGSARPSMTTEMARRGARAMRRLERGSSRLLGPQHRLVRSGRTMARFLGDMRAVGDARDRARRYRHGVRDAASGYVVLFDRYPIEGMRLGERHVDGPRIVTGTAGRWTLRQASAEQRLQRSIALPDHVIVLDVDARVASARRRPADVEALEAKVAAVAAWVPPRTLDLVRVDADQPLPAVMHEVRRAIWSWL